MDLDVSFNYCFHLLERESACTKLTWFIPQMLATVRAVPGQNRFLEFLDGTLSRPPTWVADWKQNSRDSNWHADMRCGHPKQWLTCFTTTPALGMFSNPRMFKRGCVSLGRFCIFYVCYLSPVVCLELWGMGGVRSGFSPCFCCPDMREEVTSLLWVSAASWGLSHLFCLHQNSGKCTV